MTTTPTMIRALLHRWFHSSRRLGPFWISVWDWERQHELCCHDAPQEGPREP